MVGCSLLLVQGSLIKEPTPKKGFPHHNMVAGLPSGPWDLILGLGLKGFRVPGLRFRAIRQAPEVCVPRACSRFQDRS